MTALRHRVSLSLRGIVPQSPHLCYLRIATVGVKSVGKAPVTWRVLHACIGTGRVAPFLGRDGRGLDQQAGGAGDARVLREPVERHGALDAPQGGEILGGNRGIGDGGERRDGGRVQPAEEAVCLAIRVAGLPTATSLAIPAIIW